MEKGQLLAFLLIGFIPTVAWTSSRPVLSLSLGGDLIKEHLNKNITIISPFQNTYTSGGNDLEPVAGVFLGLETELYKNFQGQFGFSYYQNRTFNFTGSVYQFATPSMNNLAYHYQLSSQRFMAETKLLSTYKKHYHPYLTAGLGEAINQAYQYHEVPVSTADVPMSQGFNNRTHQTFTYQLGLGLDIDLNSHVCLGAGYRFLDLGKAGLGPTPLQEGNQTISYDHLYVNEFLMQLSFKG
jgi:opacity protein-like surface antigen